MIACTAAFGEGYAFAVSKGCVFKREAKAAMIAAGLDPATDGQEFWRGVRQAEAEQSAARTARLLAAAESRRAPYLAEAAMIAAGDDEADIDAIADQLAEEAEDQAAAEAAEEERFTAVCALRDRKLEAVQVVRDALGRKWEPMSDGYGGFGSVYTAYRSHGVRVDIRVSDHPQVAGGGWNEQTGERNGEVDVDYVIESAASELPTRSEVRKAVAEAIRASRM